jgi:hypothetical protein
MQRFSRYVMSMILIVMSLFAATTLLPQKAYALTLKSHVCNVTQVDLQMDGSSTANRLLIRCDAPATGVGGASIVYFATNTSQNAERVKMALSMMTTAKVSGRQLRIKYFSDDTSTNAWGFGCNPSDCRPILAIELL